MKREHNPPSILDAVNLETVTLRELGDIAEHHGMKLEDILSI